MGEQTPPTGSGSRADATREGVPNVSFGDDVRSAFRRGETDAVVRMSTVEIERARAVGVAGAALASAEGDHRRAALMVGLADAAFAALGQVPDPDDAADLAAVRDAAVAALGPDEYAAVQERDRQLDPRTAFDDDH
jgi:sarcosine oxidase gamma subunit